MCRNNFYIIASFSNICTPLESCFHLMPELELEEREKAFLRRLSFARNDFQFKFATWQKLLILSCRRSNLNKNLLRFKSIWEVTKRKFHSSVLNEKLHVWTFSNFSTFYSSNLFLFFLFLLRIFTSKIVF